MATAEKTVSALINRQLPDFIRADHPKFKQFLEVYYRWLEDESKGNTVYHIMRSGEYRDIDTTLDPFIRLFKQELLPYFPERSELDLIKILKGARSFYVKKGSEESVKWLFRVLFGQDVEVYYPKQQILIASDGKWKQPKAFQLTLSQANQGIDANLLERHKATGSISKATCVIESANRTIDRTFGTEILELYVSNVQKTFTNGENLEIPYVDENGVEQVFIEKIIGAISNILVDSNIRTDPQQKRRGLTYNVGDPIVVFGGLANTAEAKDAVAVVGNVTVGSIEGLQVIFPGYGYRVYSNTETVVYRSTGDDPAANTSTDIRVVGINTFDSGTNSQAKFIETVSVDKLPIEYMASVLINAGDYAVMTGNNRNIVLSVNNDGDPWYNNERVYANGASYETANFTAQVLTANSGWAGGPAQIILYNVANTVPLTTSGFLVGTDKLISTESGSVFNVASVVAQSIPANSDSQIIQALTYESIETGGVALYNIINGGYGFRSTPQITTKSYYDTFLSENYAYGTANNALYRQEIGVFGKVAHIYINNPGTGYANGQAIVVTGRGYGFTGYVNVNATGAIMTTTITNRGEGYTGTRSVSITGGGSGAALTAYGFGEGVTIGVETGAIGRVRDVRLTYRGFDYINTPLVSFKVMDMIIDGILEAESLSEGERVYQGATLETATFQGIIKSYNRSTRLLRLFNFSGASYSSFNKTLEFTSEGGVKFFVDPDPASRVPAPADYPPSVVSAGLDNPWFYGNGKAKGIAEFFAGLIQFTGFYLNTDGFLSSDKKMQDDKTYHNYSYVIESEKSLAEYENTMKDIVHPIGMSMLAKMVARSELRETILTNSIVSINPVNPVGSTVSVANSANAKVTGTSTEFTDATVGDMLWIIDTDNELRSQAKVIVAIDSDTSLNVESNFIYVGQGKLSITSACTTAYITGNVNVVGHFMQTGDRIRFNVGNTTNPVFESYTITLGSGNAISLNNAANTTNTGLVYLVVPDYTGNYDYEIIKVTE